MFIVIDLSLLMLDAIVDGHTHDADNSSIALSIETLRTISFVMNKTRTQTMAYRTKTTVGYELTSFGHDYNIALGNFQINQTKPVLIDRYQA
jgi:hypothetical protein